MNPSFGLVLWMLIGAAVGWVVSRVARGDPRQGAVVDVYLGVVGAVFGGFLAWLALGERGGVAGLLVGVALAVGGAGAAIYGWRSLAARTAR